MSDHSSAKPVANPVAWKELVHEYQRPSTRKAVWQLVNTLLPYFLLWALMAYTVRISWWLTLPLAVLAGFFLIRVFIIFHDCGHGSFFKSRKANRITGFICGLLTFTPYHHWTRQHFIHHASSGDLDKRGTGDVWTMTVQEYLAASRWKKFTYRVARNPVMLFVVAPLLLFVVLQRFPSRELGERERASVHWMNLAIVVMGVALGLLLGFKAYLLVQMTVVLVAGSAGIWLFYVQHQFEDVYWERTEAWDHTAAALQGSSFYKLPRILQWFSGNIGYHHIHHLSTRIPNYNLEACHNAHALFQSVKPVTLLSSLKSFKFRLWDEEGGRLVGYAHLRNINKSAG
ncbi:MAG: fatty acid desaturase [Verrucomicrobiales bacterium]|jgi:omega-6 fatty acid desaturase (delta-12 desaturase)|nr:fatty acid desaturase [Verrucomicrobiales bacterium]